MCIYDVYGPCSCPHGRCFTVLAQCFAVSSWVTSLMAITSCFYMFVRPIPEEGQPEMPKEGFGYISRQIGVMEPPAYRQCTWYEKAEKQEFFAGDGMWQAGRAMSLLACGIGFVVMCITLCTCCVAFELPTFEGLFWTCLLCFIAQSLTFLSWGSDLCEEYECTWSSGTGMNITAAMLWVWAANMIKSFPEALPPRGRKSSRRRGPDGNDDVDDDSPYLASNQGSTRSGFQDEYQDGDEFNDWGDNSQYTGQSGYYDEDGNWVDEQTPQGYYDDDGNWYDYDTSSEDASGYYDENGNYLDGQQQQPESYYSGGGSIDGSDHDNEEHENPVPTQDGYGYDYNANGGREMSTVSEEEMEFLAESQRSMNQTS